MEKIKKIKLKNFDNKVRKKKKIKETNEKTSFSKKKKKYLSGHSMSATGTM